MNETEAYRVEALLELAAAFPEALTVAEIARRRSVPPKFLSRLLGELAREELVLTARGPRGGVRLAASPGEVPLARLLRASMLPEAGGAAVRWVAGRLAQAQDQLLGKLTLADLLRVERESNGVVNFEI